MRSIRSDRPLRAHLPLGWVCAWSLHGAALALLVGLFRMPLSPAQPQSCDSYALARDPALLTATCPPLVPPAAAPAAAAPPQDQAEAPVASAASCLPEIDPATEPESPPAETIAISDDLPLEPDMIRLPLVAPSHHPPSPAVVRPAAHPAPSTTQATAGHPPSTPSTSPAIPPSAAPAPVIAIVHRVMPDYPRISRQHGEQGLVLLLVIVGADGHVRTVTVEHSSGHARLDAAAVQAVNQWTFRVDGRATRSIVHARIDFRLNS